MCRAVSHKYKRGSVFICCFNALETGFFDRFLNSCLCNSFLVFVDHRRIFSDFPQKRLRDADGLKIAFDCFDSRCELVIFRTMHQMRGLDNQIFDAVFFCACQRLVYIIDHFAVAGLYMVDDDLRSKSSADRPVRICSLQGFLNAADIRCTALIKGCTEADDQELVLSDLICIERVVCGGIAGIASEIIGICGFAFHQFLLFIRKGIPGSLCRRDVVISCICAFLYVNLVDQSCALCRKFFICFVCFCCLTGFRCFVGRLRFQGLRIHSCFGMRDIDCLYVFDPAQAFDLCVNTLKAAVCRKHALPGVLFITGHIVVGVVACNDHEGPENDFLIAGFLDLCDDIFTGSLFGFTFNSADKDVLVAQRIHLGLHLAVSNLGDMCCAVSHKDKGGSVFVRRFNAVKSGSLHSFCHNCLCDSLLVRIDDICILADFAQKGLCNTDSLKIAGCCRHGSHELIVLRTVHQVCGLNDKILNSVFLCARQGLVDVINDLAVAGLHMVDDDLCCKSSADRPVGIGLFQGLLNTADILCTAVVKGSTETYDQKLVLSDLIRIAGIVCRSVSRVTAEIIRIREFAFHHCLLRICQGIPGSLCGLNIRIGRIRALLHIDFVDQCRAFCRKLFIRLRCFCCCSCNCRCLRCRSSCIRRYRLCSAACFGYSRAGIVCSRAALRTCTGSPAAAGKKSAGKHGGQQNRCQFSFHDFPPVE